MHLQANADMDVQIMTEAFAIQLFVRTRLCFVELQLSDNLLCLLCKNGNEII